MLPCNPMNKIAKETNWGRIVLYCTVLMFSLSRRILKGKEKRISFEAEAEVEEWEEEENSLLIPLGYVYIIWNKVVKTFRFS